MRLPLLLLAGLLPFVTGCSDFYNFFGIEDPEDRRIRERQFMEWHLQQANVSEPTIDLIEVAAGDQVATATQGPLLGVGVKTAGGPTPDTAYSNFVELRVTREDAPGWVVRVVKERHDGVNDTILEVEGGAEKDVDPMDIDVFAVDPWGFFFGIPLPEDIERDQIILEIFLGIISGEGGPFLEDESGELEMKETEGVEDILSEIEEVFVPA